MHVGQQKLTDLIYIRLPYRVPYLRQAPRPLQNSPALRWRVAKVCRAKHRHCQGSRQILLLRLTGRQAAVMQNRALRLCLWRSGWRKGHRSPTCGGCMSWIRWPNQHTFHLVGLPILCSPCVHYMWFCFQVTGGGARHGDRDQGGRGLKVV